MKKLLLIFCILALPSSVTGVTWMLPAFLPAPADSVWVVKAEDGTRIDSAKWGATTQAIDTTITVSVGTYYTVYFNIWYADEDSSVTWVWTRDMTVGNMRYEYSDSILLLRGLHVRGTTANDTALIAFGNTVGAGAVFKGGATNGTGFIAAGQGTGKGLAALGGSGNSDGFYAYGAGTGSGIYGLAAATGHGFYARSLGAGDGIHASTSTGDEIEGQLKDSVIVDVSSADAAGGLVNQFWEADSSSIDAGMGEMLKDTSAYQGLAGAGSGANVVKIFAVDSSGTPRKVNDVLIAIWSTDLATLVGVDHTNNPDNGAEFNLNNGNYVMVGTAPSFRFTSYDTLAVSGATTDTTWGYDIASAYPAGTKACYVTGKVIGPGADPGDAIEGIPNIPIYITATKSGVIDSAGNVIATDQPILAATDATGNWGAYVIYSAYMIPPMPWNITIGVPGGSISGTVVIPQQATGIFKKDSEGQWVIE